MPFEANLVFLDTTSNVRTELSAASSAAAPLSLQPADVHDAAARAYTHPARATRSEQPTLARDCVPSEAARAPTTGHERCSEVLTPAADSRC